MRELKPKKVQKCKNNQNLPLFSGTFASVNNGTVLNYINDDKNCVATKTKQAASLYCSCGEEFAVQDIRPSSDGCLD